MAPSRRASTRKKAGSEIPAEEVVATSTEGGIFSNLPAWAKFLPFSSFWPTWPSMSALAGTASPRPVVRIRDGDLRGQTHRTEDGRTYHSFRGIPYGRPPVGDLRFKAPEPAQPWTGIRDASREGTFCTQPFVSFNLQPESWSLRDIKAFVATIPMVVSRVGKILRQSEDCLFLNVHTPALPCPGEPLLPVVFWVHGGAFLIGDADSDMYGPDYFVDKGIVVVSINYRLGPFGFLSVGTDAAPGNAGLKDQALALRWVRDNVAAFGGDPNRVTLYGASAGAVAVHLHTLSPLSRGLFNAAIMSSGSALHDWAMTPQPLANARELAHHLGIKASEPNDLVAGLRGQSATRIMKAVYKMKPHGRFVGQEMNFMAVVEPPGPGAFLCEHPLDIVKRGDQASAPTLFSVNSREGLSWIFGNPTAGRVNPQSDSEMALLDRRRANEFFLTDEMYATLSPELRSQCHQEIMEYYFGNKSIQLETLPQFLDIFGDINFVNPLFSVTKLHASNKNTPVYVCYLNFNGRLHFFRRILRHNHLGMGHGDELGYFFRVNLLPEIELAADSAEKVFRQRLLALWCNFIKTGNPTPPEDSEGLGVTCTRAWQNGRMDYLEVGDTLSMRQDPPTSRVTFWDDLHQRYLGRSLVR